MTLRLVNTSKDLSCILKNKTPGFVPTMGNLHQGHLDLIEQSLKDNQLTVVSIFVNPTQFSQGEDLDSYPRTLEEDENKITALMDFYKEKDLVIFAPQDTNEIYGYKKNEHIEVPFHEHTLEGKLRSTHFKGVVQVVSLLFELTHPKTAYFGKKDYQQLVIIKEMSRIHFPTINIIGVEIAREESGLALSSRNGYLTDEEKEQALLLRRSLILIKESFIKDGYQQAVKLIDELLSKHKEINYLQMRDQLSFDIATDKTQDIVILGNMNISHINILDNIEVSSK